MIRLHVINGNTYGAMTANIDTQARRVARADTQILTTQPEAGPMTIESYYDEYLAIPGILAQIIRHEAATDAFILACWGDPGIEAAREITHKPVVGIAEASLYVANTLGAKFGVVSTLKRTQHMVEKTIEKVGLQSRCALALCTDLPVAATEDDRDLTLRVLEAGSRTVIAAGAEVIVLGCAGMSGLDDALAQRLGMPVIDAVAAAVVWAEALVQLGKSTSKAMTYRPPEDKPIVGYPDFMQPSHLR
ncbi:MAG: aspartate/glutamate racemase family protein [Caldilineaceae bacterium]|nr:aspartate/glutamate racemase family protein [Caldilineaceae bacterium]